MSDIVSILGNPVRDNKAIHFPVSAGSPVYPEKKSNVIVNADGSISYEIAEDAAKINKDVVTTSGKYKPDNGGIQNASNKARSVNWVPTNASILKVDDTGYVTGIEVLAWNSAGTYVGVWDAENKSFVTTEKYYEEIDFKKVWSAYPTYKFKLSFSIVDSSISYIEARDHVLWVNTELVAIKQTADEDHSVMLFDTSKITVIQNYEISGYQGTVNYNENYVATDYVDISKRIGNTIEFNSSFIANNTGCAFYDKGKNRIDGIWYNKPDFSSLGLISDYPPQHVVYTVPTDACYVRACMRKDWYTEPSDFNFKFLVSNKSNIADKEYNTNFISIAHKGYGYAGYADTLDAFIGAGEAGFTAVEIDCRITTDGIFVVSHNDTDTYYRNGTSQSVTISTSSWADLKGLTVDSAGTHPLCTLAQVFNTLKKYKVRYYIIDLKTGTNAEIMKVARRCGVVSQIMLSYYSQQSLLDDLQMIEKYPQISIRFTPLLTPEAYSTVVSSINNQLFADVNLSDGGSTYFPKALSMQLPILFSGVQESNKNVMAALGCGAMAQTTTQYSPYDFAKMIDLDLNQFPTLSTETESVSISTGNNATVTVESDIDDPACWVYGYSDDLSVCNVVQSSYGANVTFTVEKVGVGTANLIVFTPTGEQLLIPVTAT